MWPFIGPSFSTIPFTAQLAALVAHGRCHWLGYTRALNRDIKIGPPVSDDDSHMPFGHGTNILRQCRGYDSTARQKQFPNILYCQCMYLFIQSFHLVLLNVVLYTLVSAWRFSHLVRHCRPYQPHSGNPLINVEEVVPSTFPGLDFAPAAF